MNANNVNKWLDELSTTNKPQGTAYLLRDGEYCCLGIACDVASKEIKIAIDRSTLDGAVFFDDENSILPPSVADWLGIAVNPRVTLRNLNYDPNVTNEIISEYDPQTGEGGMRYSNPEFLVSRLLTDLNDDLHLTFYQIADLVRYCGLDD